MKKCFAFFHTKCRILMSFRLFADLFLNTALFFLCIYGCILACRGYGLIHELRYYTFNSNVFGILGSGVYLAGRVAGLINGSYTVPFFAILLKYMSTCCLTLTFIVVVAILCPMDIGTTVDDKVLTAKDSYLGGLFSSSLKYQHFLCPVLAIITVLFIDCRFSPDTVIAGQTINAGIIALIATIPTFVYGLTVVILNLLKKLEGPYPFLKVYKQPWYMSCIWSVVVVGGAYLIALVLYIAGMNLG